MKLHHIGIEVADLVAAGQFYEMLGFTIESCVELDGEKLLFIKKDGYRLELFEVPEDFDEEFHICFEVHDFDSLPKLPKIEGSVFYENGWESVYLRGLDGMVIEFLKK